MKRWVRIIGRLVLYGFGVMALVIVVVIASTDSYVCELTRPRATTDSSILAACAAFAASEQRKCIGPTETIYGPLPDIDCQRFNLRWEADDDRRTHIAVDWLGPDLV